LGPAGGKEFEKKGAKKETTKGRKGNGELGRVGF